MPRWFGATASAALLVAMGAGVLYPGPAPLSIGALLLLLLLIVSAAGVVANGVRDRHDRKANEPTTLDLNH
jgi:4-hydroxybenzoate polyprenyltransferase